MKGNKSRPVDQRIYISDPSVQSDDPPRELVERRTPSSTHKVAQRMRELSPLQSNNSSRFSVASMQASRITHSTEKDARPVSVHMTGGNAWTNARSLVDFSASMVHTKEDPSDSYSGEQAEPAASSILFWHRDESYDSPQKSTPQRNLWSGDETGRSGSAPNPNKTMSFSTSPVTYSGTMRRTGTICSIISLNSLISVVLQVDITRHPRSPPLPTAGMRPGRPVRDGEARPPNPSPRSA